MFEETRKALFKAAEKLAAPFKKLNESMEQQEENTKDEDVVNEHAIIITRSGNAMYVVKMRRSYEDEAVLVDGFLMNHEIISVNTVISQAIENNFIYKTSMPDLFKNAETFTDYELWHDDIFFDLILKDDEKKIIRQSIENTYNTCMLFKDKCIISLKDGIYLPKEIDCVDLTFHILPRQAGADLIEKQMNEDAEDKKPEEPARDANVKVDEMSDDTDECGTIIVTKRGEIYYVVATSYSKITPLDDVYIKGFELSESIKDTLNSSDVFSTTVYTLLSGSTKNMYHVWLEDVSRVFTPTDLTEIHVDIIKDIYYGAITGIDTSHMGMAWELTFDANRELHNIIAKQNIQPVKTNIFDHTIIVTKNSGVYYVVQAETEEFGRNTMYHLWGFAIDHKDLNLEKVLHDHEHMELWLPGLFEGSLLMHDLRLEEDRIAFILHLENTSEKTENVLNDINKAYQEFSNKQKRSTQYIGKSEAFSMSMYCVRFKDVVVDATELGKELIMDYDTDCSLDKFINKTEMRDFIFNSNKASSRKRLVERYDFLNSDEDIDLYRDAFSTILDGKQLSLDLEEPLSHSKKTGADFDSVPVQKDEPKKKPNKKKASDEKVDSNKVETRKTSNQKNKEIIGSKKLSKQFIEDRSKMSLSEMAKKYGISATSVGRMVTRIKEKYPEFK